MNFDYRKAWHTYVAMIGVMWVIFNMGGAANESRAPYLMSLLLAWVTASLMAPPVLAVIGVLQLFKWSKEDENPREDM